MSPDRDSLFFFAFLLAFFVGGGDTRRYRKVPYGSVTSPMTPVSNGVDNEVQLLPRQPHSVIPEQYFGRSLLSHSASSASGARSSSLATDFKVNNPTLCGGRQEVLLLMLVMSEPKHVERRMAIRDTWGSSSSMHVRTSTTHETHSMPLAFLLGDSTEHTAQMDVAAEHNIYADIVQGTFLDSSTNLTLKTVAAFQWAKTFCSKAAFVMVATDEVLVDTYKLAPFLQVQRSHESFVLCHLVPCCKPVNLPSSPSDSMYAGKAYPAHCSGHAFVLPSSLISRMHSASLHTPLFTPHQVFVGVLAEKLGVPLHDTTASFEEDASLPERLVQQSSYVDSPLMVAIVQHSSVLRRLWWSILDQHSQHARRATAATVHMTSPELHSVTSWSVETWLVVVFVICFLLSRRRKLLLMPRCR